MDSDHDDEPGDLLLDGSEILTCTASTMDMLRRALADELGLDEAEDYGLAPRRPALAAVEETSDPPPD